MDVDLPWRFESYLESVHKWPFMDPFKKVLAFTFANTDKDLSLCYAFEEVKSG
jgi:hypothetical protein